MTFNQISMTKLKSRYKHEKCRTFCVLRAYAGLYVFSMTFQGLEMTILKFHDFSRFSMTVRTLQVDR